jgi:hypothetical protein
MPTHQAAVKLSGSASQRTILIRIAPDQLLEVQIRYIWYISLNKLCICLIARIGSNFRHYVMLFRFSDDVMNDMEINHINCSVGVLKGFVQALVAKYPEIPVQAIQKYIKSRLEIWLKAVNRKLHEKRAEQRQKRSDRLYKITQNCRLRILMSQMQ